MSGFISNIQYGRIHSTRFLLLAKHGRRIPLPCAAMTYFTSSTWRTLLPSGCYQLQLCFDLQWYWLCAMHTNCHVCWFRRFLFEVRRFQFMDCDLSRSMQSLFILRCPTVAFIDQSEAHSAHSDSILSCTLACMSETWRFRLFYYSRGCSSAIVCSRESENASYQSLTMVLIIYYGCKPSRMLISSISVWICPTLQYSNCGYKNICHAPTLSHGLCDPWSADLAFAWMLVNCIIFVLDQMYWIMCFRDRVCSGKDVAFAFILRRYIVLTGSQVLVLMNYGLSMNSSCTQDRMFKSTS